MQVLASARRSYHLRDGSVTYRVIDASIGAYNEEINREREGNFLSETLLQELLEDHANQEARCCQDQGSSVAGVHLLPDADCFLQRVMGCSCWSLVLLLPLRTLTRMRERGPALLRTPWMPRAVGT